MGTTQQHNIVKRSEYNNNNNNCGKRIDSRTQTLSS